MTEPDPGAGDTRAPELSREQLAALHPYVVDVPDGRLTAGASTPPTSVADFQTTRADVDALFDEHLPAFLASRPPPVPVVIWAHGGLVSKASGLTVAHRQVEWWRANGAFPVHFVWETGLADSLWDAAKDALPGRGRGFEDVLDRLIERAVRGAGARQVWAAMKTTAALASEHGRGGAWYFAQRLGRFLDSHPGAVTVHAVGHSAGSVFHGHLVPAMLDAGLPTLSSLNLLAPAVGVEEFRARLLAKPVGDRIERIAMFTMSESFEKDDTCLGIYRKSLLYLIRASLEDRAGAEILGLQECVRRDRDLSALFGAAGSGGRGEVIWSRTVGGGPATSSRAQTHGGFDEDSDTMNSLARRIIGRSDLPRRWTRSGGRGAAESLWPSEQEAWDYLESREAGTVPSRRRALCIGIDAYPDPGDRLRCCVADARAWKLELERLGFDVDLLEDEDATRERMVERIQDLVVSSRAGDVLALQYSGHGTTVDDLDLDEVEEDKGGPLADEALCPVDFRAGNLLIDDDLGEIWDLLPEDVSLTIFFDSCHSGGNQREVRLVPAAPTESLPRLARLSFGEVAAFRALRGTQEPQPQQQGRSASRDNERGVYFAACLPEEVAWESEGSGDFTRRALPLLRALAGGSTNRAFHEGILAAFGDGRRQTPVLLPPQLADGPFLAAVQPSVAVDPGGLVASLPTSGVQREGPPNERDRAVAAILRGVADLLES